MIPKLRYVLRSNPVRDHILSTLKPDQSRVIILLYHRVSDVEFDPQLLCVEPSNFDAQLEILRRRYRVIGLLDLMEDLKRGPVTEPTVVITFDDGYLDNLQQAKPLLGKHYVPATIFVTTGLVGRHEEFWWDELERITLGDRQLPEDLTLKTKAGILQWHLGGSARIARHEHTGFQSWSVEDETNPTLRHQLYRDLCTILRPLQVDDREAILRELRTWAGVTRTGRPAYRAMAEEELRDLASGPLIDIGAHTMNHQQLSTQPLATQRQEVMEGKSSLEMLLGSSVSSFAYPFGTPADYTPETVELVKEAGYICACSNFPGGVGSKTPRFELPRFLVRNWSGSTFAARLEAWFGAG